MAAVDQRDLPVHLAEELDERTDFVVLAPAQRWRTLIDGVSHVQGDVLLTTVARFVAAGAAPLQISEALQLPDDLITHLVARVRLERIKVAEDGRALVSESAILGWIYRDLITDDLNPTIGPERPAVDVRWQHDRATFTTGTTGKPRRIHAAALFTPKTDPAPPTAHELGRLAAERPGGECRLTLVGADELCLLVHPIQVVDHEAVVVDAAGRPQLQMTRSLHETARSKPALRAWLDRAVDSEPVTVVSSTTDSPLGRSVLGLFKARQDFEAHRSARAARQLLEAVELVLRRYCARTWFRSQIDPSQFPPVMVDAGSLAAAFGITESEAAALLGDHDADARRTSQELVRLALESRHRSELQAVNVLALVQLGAEFVVLRGTQGQFERLSRCALQVEDLGRQALNDQKDHHERSQ